MFQITDMRGFYKEHSTDNVLPSGVGWEANAATAFLVQLNYGLTPQILPVKFFDSGRPTVSNFQFYFAHRCH